MFVSTFLGSPIPLDTQRLIRDLVFRNKVAIGVPGSSAMGFEAAIRDLETFLLRWPQALHTLITERLPLKQAPAVLLHENVGIKQVVTMNLYTGAP